ncbi:hypothetical protein Efla_000283 [Eimeria flavescens]
MQPSDEVFPPLPPLGSSISAGPVDGAGGSHSVLAELSRHHAASSALDSAADALLRGAANPCHSSAPNASKGTDDSGDEVERRPVVSKEAVMRYMDQAELDGFLLHHNLTAEEYSEGVAFSVGEGGRELLRAALLQYTDGRTLQGASVPQLLRHAHSLGLWPLAQRIRAERSAGVLTDLHLAFANFKAAQSRRRRRSAAASMHVVRGEDGRILSIIYDPSKTLPIGLQGRIKLKLLITKRMEEDPTKAAALLIEHGLDGVSLREATVAELLAVAWVLGLWRSVEDIVQENEQRRRNALAKKAAGGPAGSLGGAAAACEDQPERPCKRRRPLLQKSSAQEATREGVLSAASLEAPSEAAAEAGALAARPLAGADAQSPSSSPSYVESQISGSDECTQADVVLPGADDCVAASEDETAKHCVADPHLADGTPPGDLASSGASQCAESYRHLERIGQLVACANPTAPNAKSVAAEVVKELLALVNKRLLPDPPEEVLRQLQSAAVRLGVDAAPTSASQAADAS